ncbi:MAG: sigma-70 family RNA polymerase sigma factor [Acidobacteriota bacterium]
MSPAAAESSLRLLHRAKEGDEAALEALLARSLPRLRRWASGRLPRTARLAADTEDLVQDSIVRVLRNLRTFEIRGDGAFQAYARQAILNRIVDIHRRTERSWRHAEPLASDLPAASLSPLELAIGAENVERYERALAALREEDRQAVILRLELGYDFREIAEALGRPSPEAARVAVSRAVARLSRIMSGDDGS